MSIRKEDFAILIEGGSSEFNSEFNVFRYNFDNYGILPTTGDQLIDDDGENCVITSRTFHKGGVILWCSLVE